MEVDDAAKADRRAVWRGQAAIAHLPAGKVAPAGKEIAAGVDEQQRASSLHGDLGPEEGEEQFSPCNTLLCDRIDDNCCIGEAHGRS